ncbi:MAG: hypothetical protein IT233_00350 [Bacteroidia bacterium]|nr:hypothetical protein [Bacteroidia bacterium]
MQSFRKALKQIPIPAAVMGIFFFVYVAWRAFCISFTYDEAYSFLYFVKSDWDLLRPENYMAGNNHPVNTWMMDFFSCLFGESEGVLRIHSVLAFLIYAFFCFRITGLLSRPDLRLVAWCLLLANPFILDFFSLARGYGMMLAFSTGAVWYGVFSDVTRKHILFFSLFALVAVFSNLVSLHLVAAAGGILVFRIGFRKENIPACVFFLAGVSLLGILVIPFALSLREVNSLFFGGKDGFWMDTAGSLLRVSFYRTATQWPPLLFALIPASLFLVFTLRFLFMLNVRGHLYKRAFLLLVITGLLGVVQHLVADTPYLSERTALPLMPAGIFTLVWFADSLNRKLPALVFSLLLIPVALFHFFRTANFTHTEQWSEDRNTREMFRRVHTLHPEAVISGDFIFETVSNFYRYRAGGEGAYYRTGAPEDFSTHCFVMRESKLKPSGTEWRRIFFDPETGNEIWERNSVLTATPVLELTESYGSQVPVPLPVHRSSTGCPSPPLCGFTDGSGAQFCSWLEWRVPDSINQYAFFVEQEGILLFGKGETRGGIVMEITDSVGVGEWSIIPWGWIRRTETGAARFRLSRILKGGARAGNRIKLYIWNYGHSEVKVDDVRSRISINLATP